jgi:DNA-binding HxlR family transcriptional regulator
MCCSRESKSVHIGTSVLVIPRRSILASSFRTKEQRVFAKERNDYEGDLSNVDAIASVIAGADVVVTAYLRHSSSCIEAAQPDILEKLLKLRIGCPMGIRTDLLVTEEIAESSDLRATAFEFERAKRVEAALSILEGKWKIVILNRLFARPIWRFSELERAVPGISQRMLSQQLRLLAKCELVRRTVHPQFPPKVEYELTEFGKTLCPAMKTLVDWAMTFHKTRETSRYQPRKARKAF